MNNVCMVCHDNSGYTLNQYQTLLRSIPQVTLTEKKNLNQLKVFLSRIHRHGSTKFRCSYGLPQSVCRYHSNYNQIEQYQHQIAEKLFIMALNQDTRYEQVLYRVRKVNPQMAVRITSIVK